MSFWAGVASGFKDAKAAKAEKEELEARRAERAETFEYNKGRDEKADARYATEQAENLRRWQLGHDIQVKTYDENKAWRESQAEREQGNLDRTFTTNEKWKNKEWAQGVDKWKFTKDQAKEATEHSNKLFNMALDKFEYSKDRDVVQDAMNYRAEARAVAEALRVKEAQTFNEEMATKNFEMREDQFEEQMRAAGVSEDLAKKGFDLKVEQLEIARTTQLLSMIPSSLTDTMSGDGKGSAGSKGHAMSKEAMVKGSKIFKAEYSNLSDEAKESDFFKAAANSPATQATLMAFVEAQAKKGNTVTLDELPKYFKYAGSTEGQGTAKAKETIDSLMSGEMDLKDKDAFVKGLMSLKNYKPSEELFIQTSSPDDLKTKSEKIKYWETAIETDAYRKLDSFAPDDRRKIDNALTGLQRKERRTESLDILASYGLGMDAVTENNMADIGVIKSYYGDKLDAPVEAEELPETLVEELPETILEEEPNTRTPFASFDEAQAAIKEGFTGKYSVGGKPYKTEGVSLDSDHPLNTDKVTDEDLMEAELLEMKKFEEEDNLKESGAAEKYFNQQADGLDRMGKGTTEEQVEGSRPGEREIDTDTFVDRSFQGEGDEAMDLEGASAEIVSEKIFDVVDSVPPRTPKKNRVEWAVKEFKKRYTNALMSDEEIEVRIESLLSSNQ